MTETALHEARGVYGDILLQIYGQNEGAPLTYLPPDDHLAEGGRWLRSAGKPTPNARITVVDEEGAPCPRRSRRGRRRDPERVCVDLCFYQRSCGAFGPGDTTPGSSVTGGPVMPSRRPGAPLRDRSKR
ncbi:AMP-binding protein [Lipingzhangella halophila]|uniref:AMP-binding protein n=1 Tax=Lipingzhangella halophila TaxID=1783352 RepID=UPI00160D5BCE